MTQLALDGKMRLHYTLSLLLLVVVTPSLAILQWNDKHHGVDQRLSPTPTMSVKEGTIKPPWKTAYAAVMSAPPLLLLAYFAFVF